jgi:uncharacterized membrane-anchored protein
MMFKKIIIFSCLLLAFGLFASAYFVAPAAADGDTVALDNPLTSDNTDPAYLIGLIIKAAMGLVGGAALVMTVYGGFQWLTSAGNQEKVKKGTATMIWSIIGLILVLASYLIMQNVLGFIGAE